MGHVSSDCLIAQPRWMHGRARFFDWGGYFASFNRSASESEADARALCSAWRIIGEDIMSAMQNYASEASASGEPRPTSFAPRISKPRRRLCRNFAFQRLDFQNHFRHRRCSRATVRFSPVLRQQTLCSQAIPVGLAGGASSFATTSNLPPKRPVLAELDGTRSGTRSPR